MKDKITLREFLIKFTAIPIKFIDEYTKFYDKCKNNVFGINLKEIMTYLNIENLLKFEERIRANYIESIDYEKIVLKQKAMKGIKDVHYMISFEGFEKIAMRSNTKKGQMFRDYFIMLRKFIDYYKEHITEKIMELTQTQKFIYILLVNKNKNIFKLGRTNDIRKRLRTYATGKDNHPDIKFIMIVNDDKKVESCSKLFLKVKQFKSNKELYKTNLDYLRKTIMNCAQMDDDLKAEIEKIRMDGKDDKYNSYIVFDDGNNDSIEYVNLSTAKIGNIRNAKLDPLTKKQQKVNRIRSHKTKHIL